MILTALTLLLAIDRCAPVERAAPDAGLARVYAKIAKEEASRGAYAASAAAWRLAAQLEPIGGPAEQTLQRLCSELKPTTAFERGEALFNANDCPSALPLLREARGGPDDTAAALLEGVCAWEVAEDAAALAALEVARGDAELAPTAELFLGLLALRQGDNGSALARLGTAAHLLRRAARSKRLLIEAVAESGYDSNASLAAFATALPGGADDAFVAATASVTLRPLADNGPYFLLGGGYRKQVRFGQSDVGLATGTLGWELKLSRARASIDYGLDFISLGAAPWMLRHRGTVRVLLPVGGALLSAEYALRHELLWPQSAIADTGFRHAGRAAVAFRISKHLFELAAVVTRAVASTADRSGIEAGCELRWLVRPMARVDFEVDVGARGRRFDAEDSDLLVLREELELDARVGADWALNRNVSLFIQLEGRRVASTVGALTYTRLGASSGLRLSWEVW